MLPTEYQLDCDSDPTEMRFGGREGIWIFSGSFSQGNILCDLQKLWVVLLDIFWIELVQIIRHQRLLIIVTCFPNFIVVFVMQQKNGNWICLILELIPYVLLLLVSNLTCWVILRNWDFDEIVWVITSSRNYSNILWLYPSNLQFEKLGRFSSTHQD